MEEETLKLRPDEYKLVVGKVEDSKGGRHFQTERIKYVSILREQSLALFEKQSPL